MLTLAIVIGICVLALAGLGIMALRGRRGDTPRPPKAERPAAKPLRTKRERPAAPIEADDTAVAERMARLAKRAAAEGSAPAVEREQEAPLPGLAAPAPTETVVRPAAPPAEPLPLPAGPEDEPVANTPAPSFHGAEEVIARAAEQAIVFRQHMPPRQEDGWLSFFGGAPVGPTTLEWPRGRDREGQMVPLTFIMQVDCAAIPAEARLDVLPDSGVIYLFLDLEWGYEFGTRVLYAADADASWGPLPVPADLPPAFGDQAHYVWKWTEAIAGGKALSPRLLPRWTFDPVAIAVPPEADDEEEPSPVAWFPGETAVQRALLAAEAEPEPRVPGTILFGEGRTLQRPLDAYPQDWRAIQIGAGLMFARAAREIKYPSRSQPEGGPEAHQARMEAVQAEAQTWFDEAGAKPAFGAVPQPVRDAFWDWLAGHQSIAHHVVEDAVTLAVEASLTHSADAAERIDVAGAEVAWPRHLLAMWYNGQPFATTPDRMLAAPSMVQGDAEEIAAEALLLFELSSNEGLGHHFGEGVYQLFITPADLAARRFDRVRLVAQAY